MSNWKDLAVEQPDGPQLVLIKPADGSDLPSLGHVSKDSDGQLSIWDEHAEYSIDELKEGLLLWAEIPED